MADIIDFNQKAAQIKIDSFVKEFVIEAFREITAGNDKEFGQDYFLEKLNSIIETHHLSDEQVDEIVKKLTTGDWVKETLDKYVDDTIEKMKKETGDND